MHVQIVYLNIIKMTCTTAETDFFVYTLQTSNVFYKSRVQTVLASPLQAPS